MEIGYYNKIKFGYYNKINNTGFKPESSPCKESLITTRVPTLNVTWIPFIGIILFISNDECWFVHKVIIIIIKMRDNKKRMPFLFYFIYNNCVLIIKFFICSNI